MKTKKNLELLLDDCIADKLMLALENIELEKQINILKTENKKLKSQIKAGIAMDVYKTKLRHMNVKNQLKLLTDKSGHADIRIYISVSFFLSFAISGLLAYCGT